jgi:hypothetical protein
MIRDPSDGSVRPPIVKKALEAAVEFINDDLAKANADLGFPPVPKDELARLEKAREWLKTYFAPRSA